MLRDVITEVLTMTRPKLLGAFSVGLFWYTKTGSEDDGSVSTDCVRAERLKDDFSGFS